jgi:hypothetical protein
MEKLSKSRLSNQAIAILSRYTQKARGKLGTVKVIDLVNNHEYAFDQFAQTVLSDDEELVSLTLKANGELNGEADLINAFHAYSNAYKAKPKNEQTVQHHRYYLLKLAKLLYGIHLDGSSYRKVVNQLIQNEESSKKVFCIDMARNFYPYIINANHTASDMSQGPALLFDQQKKSLMDLWHELGGQVLSLSETDQISSYAEAMKKIRLVEKEIDVRSKIAKIILIGQQQYTKTSAGYRDNIDKLLVLISSARLKDYVLVVSREFYPFCMNTQTSR